MVHMIIVAQITNKAEEQELRFIAQVLLMKERIWCLTRQHTTSD